MTSPAAGNPRRAEFPLRTHPFGGAATVWRLIATFTMLCSLAGAMVSGPTSSVSASSQDCGDGQVWDDAQQMCVDQEPSNCVDGQIWDDVQQMCVDPPAEGDSGSQDQSVETTSAEGDMPTATETVVPTATATATATTASMATGLLVVSTVSCPSGYVPNGPGANPVVDCITLLDGVQVTYRGADHLPVAQSTTGGTTTFANLPAGPFSLDSIAPAGSTVGAWQCQGTISLQIAGQGSSVSGQIVDGEQVTCTIVILAQPLAVGSPTTRPSLVGPSGSPAPSLEGTGPGSIRIAMSMCPPGFDPNAADANAGNTCGTDYRFVAYPLTFTAIGKSSDMSTTGALDTFFDWVTFDDLDPDTYRVQAPIPAGISAIIDKYGTCGEAISTSGGLVAFDMKIDAGGFVSCDLAAVLDPSAPTPTRAPSTESSSFSIGTSVCPAGFVPGTDANPFSACTSGPAGIRYNLTGPTGSANPLAVAATDNLILSATAGSYHVTYSLPEGIDSIAAGRCSQYDLHEQQWIDEAILALSISGRDVTVDIDVLGAMMITCIMYAVPTGPSPTPTSSPTLTPTITPTPSATQPQTASQTSGQASTGSQGGPANSGSGSAQQPQGGEQGGPDNTGPSATGTPESGATGGLAFVINAFLCPVGVQYSPRSTVMPEGCFDPNSGAVFTVNGLKTGASLQATVGDILPGAALFTDLPVDEYIITEQATPGILDSLGTCTLLGGNAHGDPVTPYAFSGSLQQVFDVATRVFVCDWYSIPDASFSGIPSPNPPQGVSLTIHAFDCPAGYDPSSADARPTYDCLAPASGVPFSLAGQDSGSTVEQSTGADAGANPQDGTSHSGTVTFPGLAADTYTLTQGNADGPANAFISSCSLATAQDADVPIYPTVSNGAFQYQFNDNEALTCLWYIIPGNGQDDQAPAGGSTQGGASDDESQGGASDDDSQDAAPPADATSNSDPSSLYLFTYQCPAGYDPAANADSLAGDCAMPLDGLSIAISGKASGFSSQVQSGASFPGGLMLTGLAPDTYHLTATLASGQAVLAIPCEVSGARDGSVQPAVTLVVSASGETDIVVPADRTISCTWYIVPAASAQVPAASAVHFANADVQRSGDRRTVR